MCTFKTIFLYQDNLYKKLVKTQTKLENCSNQIIYFMAFNQMYVRMRKKKSSNKIYLTFYVIT